MNCKGFTMVSVLIALLIMILFFTSTTAILNHSFLVKINSNVQYEMARVAQGVIEEFKGNLRKGIDFEDISFTPYSLNYTTNFNIEPVSEDDLLFITSCLVTEFKGSRDMGIYRIIYINPKLSNDFYYSEFSIAP